MIPAQANLCGEASLRKMFLERRDEGLSAFCESVTLRRVDARRNLTLVVEGQSLDVFREQMPTQLAILSNATVPLFGIGNLEDRLLDTFPLKPCLNGRVFQMSLCGEGPHES